MYRRHHHRPRLNDNPLKRRYEQYAHREELKTMTRAQSHEAIAQKARIDNMRKNYVGPRFNDPLEYFDALNTEEQLYTKIINGCIHPNGIEWQRKQILQEKAQKRKQEKEENEAWERVCKAREEQKKKEHSQLEQVRKQLRSDETTLDLRSFHPLEPKVFTSLFEELPRPLYPLEPKVSTGIFTELPVHKREIILDINQLRPFPVNELLELGKNMPHVLSITVEGDLNEQDKIKVSAFKAVVDSLAPKHFNQVKQVLNKQVKGEIKGEFNEKLKKIIYPKQSRPQSLIFEYVFGHYPFFGSKPKPAIQDEGCAAHCACTIS